MNTIADPGSSTGSAAAATRKCALALTANVSSPRTARGPAIPRPSPAAAASEGSVMNGPHGRRARRQRHVERVEQERDQRVVPAQRDQLDHPGVAEEGVRGIVGGAVDPTINTQLAGHRVDGSFVVRLERRACPTPARRPPTARPPTLPPPRRRRRTPPI